MVVAYSTHTPQSMHACPAAYSSISTCAHPNVLADLRHLVVMLEWLVKQHGCPVHLDGLCACEHKRGEGGQGEGGVFVPHLHTHAHRKAEHGQVLRCEGEVLVVNVRVAGENSYEEERDEEANEGEEGLRSYEEELKR